MQMTSEEVSCEIRAHLNKEANVHAVYAALTEEGCMPPCGEFNRNYLLGILDELLVRVDHDEDLRQRVESVRGSALVYGDAAIADAMNFGLAFAGQLRRLGAN